MWELFLLLAQIWEIARFGESVFWVPINLKRHTFVNIRVTEDRVSCSSILYRENYRCIMCLILHLKIPFHFDRIISVSLKWTFPYFLIKRSHVNLSIFCLFIWLFFKFFFTFIFFVDFYIKWDSVYNFLFSLQYFLFSSTNLWLFIGILRK